MHIVIEGKRGKKERKREREREETSSIQPIFCGQTLTLKSRMNPLSRWAVEGSSSTAVVDFCCQNRKIPIQVKVQAFPLFSDENDTCFQYQILNLLTQILLIVEKFTYPIQQKTRNIFTNSEKGIENSPNTITAW